MKPDSQVHLPTMRLGMPSVDEMLAKEHLSGVVLSPEDDIENETMSDVLEFNLPVGRDGSKLWQNKVISWYGVNWSELWGYEDGFHGREDELPAHRQAAARAFSENAPRRLAEYERGYSAGLALRTYVLERAARGLSQITMEI